MVGSQIVNEVTNYLIAPALFIFARLLAGSDKPEDRVQVQQAIMLTPVKVVIESSENGGLYAEIQAKALLECDVVGQMHSEYALERRLAH